VILKRKVMENYTTQRKIGAISGYLTKELKVSLQPSDLPLRKDDMMEESRDNRERSRQQGIRSNPRCCGYICASLV